MSAVAVWRVVRKYADDAGLTDVKPHDFRRFVGTQLARTNLRMAQKALGHKRLETTARHYILDELEVGVDGWVVLRMEIGNFDAAHDVADLVIVGIFCQSAPAAPPAPARQRQPTTPARH
jgi:hypothetical protein